MPSPIRDRLEEALSKIVRGDRLHPAFWAIDADAARASADASDARHAEGRTLGPLDGRLAPVKDLFDVKGQTTAAGSKVLQSSPAAARDAVAVARLRDAGAIIFGRTHMTEFAFSGLGLNPHFETLGNALDKSRIPGGSSSGAGVAVAEGLADLALGTDTGGSCRIPAVLNGAVGMKTSHGFTPLDGCFPLAPSFDTIGPLGPDVQACADAFVALTGTNARVDVAESLAGLRFGVLRKHMLDDAEASVEQAFEAAVGTIAACGAVLTSDTDAYVDPWAEVMRKWPMSAVSVEAAVVHQKEMRTHRDQYDPQIAKRIAAGFDAAAVDYLSFMRARGGIARGVSQRMADEKIDALLAPMAPVPAPLIEPLLADGRAYSIANAAMLRNPSYVNQMDLCAVALPVRLSETLYTGLQVIAPKGEDARALAIAGALEKLFKG